MKKKIITCVSIVFALSAVNICSGFKLENNKDDSAKYCGIGVFTDESETINYASKNTASYSINGDLPNYYSQASNTNCANVAGSVVIGYYDRFCEDLIPNYKSYIKLGSILKYKTLSDEVQNVIDSLYTYMGTDAGTLGTTFTGFQNGMKAYVSNCNYSYTYEDVGNLDFNKYKSAVENNKPVAIFLNNFSLMGTGEDTGTKEVIKSSHCSSAHVVIGCGYKVDTYYNSNGQVITTRTYLKVASGFSLYGVTYLCLDGKSKIDRATSIVIQWGKNGR